MTDRLEEIRARVEALAKHPDPDLEHPASAQFDMNALADMGWLVETIDSLRRTIAGHKNVGRCFFVEEKEIETVKDALLLMVAWGDTDISVKESGKQKAMQLLGKIAKKSKR